ncbi:hypothetical protein CEXT_348741 [Caerostris extrusa]|uniref:Uncharacterized protein n=1 Tax=Caerostris extrusa TaxID=172846 RepID=A0AAV4XQQ0_CAEEX|nr:hypothetical protein CEXT_348741 [Caerostris extrusa]
MCCQHSQNKFATSTSRPISPQLCSFLPVFLLLGKRMGMAILAPRQSGKKKKKVLGNKKSSRKKEKALPLAIPSQSSAATMIITHCASQRAIHGVTPCREDRVLCPLNNRKYLKPVT